MNKYTRAGNFFIGIGFALLCLFPISNLTAQTSTRVLTLNEVVEIALQQSPDAMAAMHRYRSSYWQYRNYKAGLLPALTFDATIPSLSKSIDKIITVEGDVFVERNTASYISDLSLTQNIGLTGGQIFLNSNLQRIDNFSDPKYTAYRSAPLNIGFSQQLFGYNRFKWLKKIEPIRYNEAERRYLEDVEQINITATEAFFRLLDAQIRLRIQQTNLANNDTLYQIAKGRFNIGTIAENELLQIELSLLNAQSAVEEAKLELGMRVFDLRSYLRMSDDINLELQAPEPPLLGNIDAQIALTQARSNRSDALAFERRIIAAEGKVNEAKASNRFSANLFAMYGLTQYAPDFDDVYRDPLPQQQLEIGIKIPILDWGLGKGTVRLAQSDLELERTAVQQANIDFDQEVFLKIIRYNMQPLQFSIAAKSDTVASKRYEVTKQRYLIGKIGITDLNIAQNEKDNARQGYVAALSTYWRSYYEVRKLTLYDFATNKPIVFNFSDIPDVD